MKKSVLAMSVALAAAVPAAAQDAAVPAQQVAIVTTPAVANVVRSGSEVTLELREELTTKGKKLKVGRRFQLATVGDVVVNGVVVVPSGTPAIGEVTEVRNKGMWGKSGYIGAKVVSMNLNGRHVRLTGSFDDKGVTGTAGVVGAIAVVPIAGFFVTGTSAVLPLGGQVKGFLDEDLHFKAVVAEPTVMEVPMPAEGAQVEVEGEQVTASLRMDLPPGVTCETCTK